ncbi:MAG: translational GTPase TypA [Planctomycetota bacterium]|nr:translational GTPase TypA [Planctomycetota bacterium]MDG2143888.1 translational GTPase TypA [Planctomycetota bacterium]
MNTPVRNIAIVAHVDHGKTTLVDTMFRFAGTFGAHKQVAERVMDSEDQERERGITILAKNTAIDYKGVRINIVDTPGHADFGGQVERTLNMADGIILLVDAREGPMPQTRFVLKKAFERGLKAMVMVNKIDRPDKRPEWVHDQILELFIDLGADDSMLEFPVVYGSGRDGFCSDEIEPADGWDGKDLEPLFDMILRETPDFDGDLEGNVQFQAATIDRDDFQGMIAVGRVNRGILKMGDRMALCHPDRPRYENVVIKSLFRYEGLERVPAIAVPAGDIAIVAGIEGIAIGDTLSESEHPDPMPAIKVDEPTISMVFSINDSPFAGKEGKYVTSRHVLGRLEKAAVRDAALTIKPTDSADSYEVLGRGVMHLSVLMENMRRENFEFAVSKPRVIIKDVDGVSCEPIERATVETPSDSAGRIIEYLGRRRGVLENMDADGAMTKLEFFIPSRGLIGARTALLTLSQGEAILSHVFERWEADGGVIPRRQNGVLISDRNGTVIPYALDGLQDRGTFFVSPGDDVYEGMVVGEYNREGDLPLNVCRTKKLTNMRASGRDENTKIAPPRQMSLEEFLEYVESDERLEITPKSLRLRKTLLDPNARKRASRAGV